MRSPLWFVIVTSNVVGFIATVENEKCHRFADSTGELGPLSLLEASPRLREQALNAVARSANAFAIKFVKEVGRGVLGNLVCSPISVSTILSMLSFGARNYTENQIRAVLQLPLDDFHTKIGFRALIDSLANYKRAELMIANKIFFPSDILPRSEFTDIITRVFRSEVESIDFRDSLIASKIINNWCAEKTNNFINYIVSPDAIGEDTALVLVNAIYFKGTWMAGFDPQNTRMRDFYYNNTMRKKAWLMHTIDYYNYGEIPEVDARFVELPYQSANAKQDMSMFVILPNSDKGLPALEKNLHKISVKELIRRGRIFKVILFLPRFKIESQLELRQPLERMGLTSIFDRPDFSGIVNHSRLKVSKVVQKATIVIDEFGSEAAAITALDFKYRMGNDKAKPPATAFVANHPFMAIIATTNDHPVNLFTIRYAGY